MHRLPKFFTTHKSKQMESSSNPTTPTRAKPRPRLERRNAAKNIDYEPPSSSSHFFSSSSASTSSYSPDDSLSIRTRSIDEYPWGDKTSFRVEGNEGELEILCKSLGFDGPEEFGIPAADWEAMKVRSAESSQLLSTSDNISGLIIKGAREVLDDSRVINSILGSDRCELGSYEVDDANVKFCSAEVRDVDSFSKDEGINFITCGGKSSGGGGIKGVRPPAVVLAPPPRISLPVIDDACSSWDMLKSFGPDGDRLLEIEDERGGVSSEDEGQQGAKRDEMEAEDNVTLRRRIVGQGSGGISESCSFSSTSIDDDSSSTTTDPMSISPSGTFRRQITSWEKGRHMGSGSYGSVYEGISDVGFFFAVKEVSLLNQGEDGRESIYQIEQEIAILSQLEHQNIVRYYGTDKDDSKLYIFLELLPQGSLLNSYSRYKLRDSHVSSYTRQILEGLKYLHERNVVHRDIKCANILVGVNGQAKLADFGLAKATKLNDAKSFKGSPLWMAPEVVKGSIQGYGRAADIWSLGCTVLEMLTGHFPYHPLDSYAALYRIGSGIPPSVPDNLSRDARDFILKCLQVDPDARPTSAELLGHPFVRRALPSSALASPRHNGIRV